MKKISELSELFRLKYPGQADYNAACNKLAYIIAFACEEDMLTHNEVYVKDLNTGKTERVTAGGIKENCPRLSPDGKKLAFTSDVSGVSQIYIADIHDDGAAVVNNTPVTNLRYDAKNIRWSPDGTKLLFLCDCEPELPDELLFVPMTDEERESNLLKKKNSPVIITDYGYKADEDHGFTEPRTSHLFTADLKTGDVRKLSDGCRDHVMPSWSPDGKHILVVSNRERPREESIGMDLFLIETESGKIEKLSKESWIAFYPSPFYPRYTPDGTNVVFGGLFPDISGNMPLVYLYKMKPEPGSEEVSLWPESSPAHEATCFLYNGESMAACYEKGQVSEDGKYVYFISGWQGEVNLYRAAVEGEREIVQITKGPHYYKSIGEIRNGKAVLIKGDTTHLPCIVLMELETGEETVLVDPNEWLAESAVEAPFEQWIDTLDGNGRVHGWILPPQNRIPGKKYPAVLYIHGGPTPFYGYGITWEHQCLAGAGFAVIYCNPRGSSGYGSKHENMKASKDGSAMYDLLQFTKEACSRFDFIDPDRLGVTGGSYGGYMTNWIVSHSKVFKAAVTQRSISNELIEACSADMAGTDKSFANYQDYMVHELEESAVYYAENIDVPFLILHALGDMRCPVEHAHQLFTAVKDTHPELPVRMVLFPNEGHELNNTGTIAHRMRHYKEMIDWFVKYL